MSEYAHPTHAGTVPALYPSSPLRPRPPACRVAHAALLGILAAIELQHGHHAAAERLAWRADALREAGQ